MQQLKMGWREQPVPELTIPEGFGIRTYREGDARGWIEVCSDGLGTGGWTEEDFRKSMLEMRGILPEGIFFIVNDKDSIVATATGVLKSNPDVGYLHMVSVHPGYRGKGLAKPVNAAVLRYLSVKGRKYITLDTDDFRIPAIKVYLSLGFRPILHEADMAERWSRILKVIGLGQTETFMLDGEPGPIVEACE